MILYIFLSVLLKFQLQKQVKNGLSALFEDTAKHFSAPTWV